MTLANLRVPAVVGTHVATHIQSFGKRGIESGGFLLAAEGTRLVDTIALTGTRGITRRPAQFHVSGAAIETLLEWADDAGRRIVAQFHSHATTAFLSHIDRVSGFRVANFISAVVPNFANPPKDLARWGWWQFHNNDWQEQGAPEFTVDGSISSLAFDEDGVT